MQELLSFMQESFKRIE
uniref:Uncharacterized protein n=1 Tax=Rhizophora mucronata TaxID=61149 RepID=A0A2P2IIM0_RHIMU